jgi:hypothetical protein
MEGIQLLSQNRGNTRAGMILVVGQGQTMSAVERASGRTPWTASDALPAAWNSWMDTQWQSKDSRKNANLYSTDHVLFAQTGDQSGRIPRSIYVWGNDGWAEFASPGDALRIEATGGGYVVVSSGEVLEAYLLAPSAAPEQ